MQQGGSRARGGDAGEVVAVEAEVLELGENANLSESCKFIVIHLD